MAGKKSRPEEPQQSSQAISQTPVVESGFPEPSVPPAQQSVVIPTPPLAQPEPVGQTISPQANVSSVSASIPPDLEPQKKSKIWLILIVILIVVAGVSGALYYFRTKAIQENTKEDKESSTVSKPSPTKTPVSADESSATESSVLKIDLSKYKIQVLNGSGVGGEASRLKDALEEEQFVVQDIGNADTSDYEKTIIRAKKDVQKEYLDKLKKLLGETYVLDTEEELGESADVDVVIIIGSSKKP